jgi:2'-5' RNA ligase
MEYIVSIQVPFPEKISKVLKQEKDRFVAKYGSSYKSEPHITLWLGRYTKEGFLKLIPDLQELSLKSFTISLLKPEVIKEGGLHRHLYIIDASNKEQLRALHKEISKIAVRYRSPLLREKDQKRLRAGLYGTEERQNLDSYGYARALQSFEPHITLGEIDVNDPQPVLKDIQKNLEQIEGEEIIVSQIVVVFHGKESGDEKAKLIEEVAIPFKN